MGYVSSCDDYVQRDQAAIMSVCDPEGLAAAKHVDEAGNPTLNAQLACKEVDMEAQDGVKVISEAKGTWTHAAYHLTSSTAGPPLLSLPFAMAALGWGVGIVALALGAAVSYYACYSLSLAMEHLHHKGKRSLRYCDLSEHVLGAKWTYYLVAPLQLSVCFMVVIGGILLGGQSMKEIYLVLNEEGIVELYSFIIIFGTFVLLLSQMPTMHSLRHFNFISILLCLGFSLCAFIGSLMAGSSREASVQHYNVHGTEISKVLGIFTAISVMVTAYSNPLVIEIQASMAMPIERKMLKGLGVCYSIAVSTFFPVAISGYWAFGNATNGVIFLNMFEPRKFLLVPRWLYFAGNAFACIQLIVYTVLPGIRSKDISSWDDATQRTQIAMPVYDPEHLAASKDVHEAENPAQAKFSCACEQVEMESQDGAYVVANSKGTWTHAAYHLTSSTAGPPLLSLPFAMADLGWGPGVVALALGAAVSYYACYSLSLAMEHLEHKGRRSLRYCDLSVHVLGSKWTNYLVAPLQLGLCFMVVIGGILLGGQSMKEMYLTLNEEGVLELYTFIIIFGTFVLLLSQMPTMHSLRHFNFISIFLCLGYSLCAFIGSLIAGFSKEAPVRHFDVGGTEMSKVLGIFTAISVMISAYSNPLVVEIQASMAVPVERKMVKGLGVCYSIAVLTFLPVAISGYWAFGNAVDGVIFLNMFEPRKFLLVPRWLYFAGNACACIQLIVYTVLHLHPTFERLEAVAADAKQGKFSKRNILTRIASRSVFVILAALLSSMLPFFVEFSAFMGAVGYTPICIFLPLLFYNIIIRPSTRSFSFWANYAIMTIALVVTLLGGIGSLHQIITDARIYKLFANV